MQSLTRSSAAVCALVLAGLIAGAASGASSAPAGGPVPGSPYYKVPPIYIPHPVQGRVWPVKYYGPVGIGIDLIDPNFTMRINNVEPGSPAAATGKLKVGQIIESINGRTLKDVDPRVVLADILGQVEATDGRMKLQIRGAGEVVVRLPVLGAYSDTWPLDCPKSDRIVRDLADLLARQKKPGFGSALFLLSTGEKKDLDVVRGWMKNFKGAGNYPWYNGLRGYGVCEYYLRTGDRRVLPVIKAMTDELSKTVYCGGWSGRGKASFTYMAGGHLNAAGVHCITFLLLARQCGVEVNEHMLQSSLEHFYRFAGHGNVAYGDHFPEGGFRDNGKTGGLALAMAAAALLSPGAEQSVYAQARDNCAMKSFYASSWFNRAHPAGGIGEMLHAMAGQLLIDRRPEQWRSFMNARRWHFELSRHFDGSIGIHDGGGFDASASKGGLAWGTYHALVYTAARKKLRLFGAPKTEWCKTYPLPERPWGTKADDAFVSPVPAEHEPGKVQDIRDERIPTHAAAPLAGRIGDPNASDEQLWVFAHHPEYAFRACAVRQMVMRGRDQLIVRLLESKDPRVRHAGIMAISGMFKGRPLPKERVTDEMWDLVGKMLEDPDESWWVAQEAMKALARADRERVAGHVDRLLAFLRHKDWWMHSRAMRALTSVAGDERFYRRVLPAVAEAVSHARAFGSSGAAGGIVKSLETASPEAQKLGLRLFGDAYAAIPDPVVAPGGQITPNQTEILRGRAYAFLRSVPGSEDVVMNMPKLTSRWQASRKEKDMYVPGGKFAANRDILGTWKPVDLVKTIDEFRWDKDRSDSRPAYRTITFKAKGKTDDASRIWTGDLLIDLGRREALKMVVKKVQVAPKAPSLTPAGGIDLGHVVMEPDAPEDPYLFIEAGGFGATKSTDWKTPWYVLKKVK